MTDNKIRSQTSGQAEGIEQYLAVVSDGVEEQWMRNADWVLLVRG